MLVEREQTDRKELDRDAIAHRLQHDVVGPLAAVLVHVHTHTYIHTYVLYVHMY